MAAASLTNHSPLLVLGASGPIGHFLLPRLLDSGIAVMAVSRRRPFSTRAGLTWIQHDLASGPAPVEADILISAGPLPLAVRQARATPGLGRIIAFSSAGVRFKQQSPDPVERELITALGQAESDLRALCDQRAVPLTLFRPTLIYGGPGNANIDLIGQWSQRFRWLPVAGDGRRQPVHAEDLARVTVDALRAGPAAAGTFELGGGETLGYRDFLRRIAKARGLNPRLLPMPGVVLKAGLAIAHRLGRLRSVRGVMIERQRSDLVVDDREARERLGWNPRPFRP